MIEIIVIIVIKKLWISCRVFSRELGDFSGYTGVGGLLRIYGSWGTSQEIGKSILIN
jgi:hypothetical protein